MNIGDRVKLTTKRHGCHASNPVWTTYFVKGTVIKMDESRERRNYITVSWDNRCRNVYNSEDLEVILIDVDELFKEIDI